MPDPQRLHGLQPSRLLHPWDFPGKSTGVGCHYCCESLEKKIKNLCFESSISASLFPHLLSSFLKKKERKKEKRKATASAFAVILSCVGVLSGIAAKSRKVLATAHCIGDYLEASQGQSQTLANCHRCNCFEKQVSSPLTSHRKMKMGNSDILFSFLLLILGNREPRQRRIEMKRGFS